jgi:hypothetical protein
MLSLAALAVGLAIFAVAIYTAWQAIAQRNVELLVTLPLAVLGFAGQVASGLPGYVWVALLVVAWLEVRIGAAEHSLRDIARGVQRLRPAGHRGPRRPTLPE